MLNHHKHTTRFFRRILAVLLCAICLSPYAFSGEKNEIPFFTEQEEINEHNVPASVFRQILTREKKIVRKFGEFRIVDNVPKSIRTIETIHPDIARKLKQLPDGGERFLQDFAEVSEETFQKFVDNPELIDAWKKMDNLGADDALRQNIGALDALKKKIAGQDPPLPSTYLDANYIKTHLEQFSDGASYLVPKDILDKFGRDILGWPDNAQFVMPKSQMDDLLSKTGNDINKICTELGINPSDWSGRELVRIDIPDPNSLNVRMPRGNEMGANKNWVPSGKTSGGRSEAVIDNISKGQYIESSL